MKNLSKTLTLTFCVLILLVLQFEVECKENIKYSHETFCDQRIKLYPKSVLYCDEKDCMFYISKENITDEEIYFNGYEKIYSKNSGSSLILEIEGENSDKVEWPNESCEPHFPPTLVPIVYPGKIYLESFDINSIMDFSKVYNSEIVIKGSYWIFYQISTDNPHVFNSGALGQIILKPCRLLVNMEEEIEHLKVEIKPSRWPLDWFDKDFNNPNFSIIIYEKDLPDKMKIFDINTNSILFNGVLKPETMWITTDNPDNRFLVLRISKYQAIRYIGYLEKGDRKKINISGRVKNGKWFIAEKNITIIGQPDNNRYQKEK